MEELEHILRDVKSYILSSPDDLTPVKTIAGGSVANTIRGLSAGFGVSCGIIGACGDDEQGKLFVCNMSSNGINLSRLRMTKGSTAQVCFTPFMEGCTNLHCVFMYFNILRMYCKLYGSVFAWLMHWAIAQCDPVSRAQSKFRYIIVLVVRFCKCMHFGYKLLNLVLWYVKQMNFNNFLG